jgi:hypothetical protein
MDQMEDLGLQLEEVVLLVVEIQQVVTHQVVLAVLVQQHQFQEVQQLILVAVAEMVVMAVQQALEVQEVVVLEI